jgi:hypothetical protein
MLSLLKIRRRWCAYPARAGLEPFSTGYNSVLACHSPVSKRFGVGTEKVCVVARFWDHPKSEALANPKVAIRIPKNCCSFGNAF